MFTGGPGGNRTPASAMRMPRNTTLLQALVWKFRYWKLEIRIPLNNFNLKQKKNKDRLYLTANFLYYTVQMYELYSS